MTRWLLLAVALTGCTRITFRAVTLEATAPGYSTFPATVTGGTDADQPVAYDFDLRRLP